MNRRSNKIETTNVFVVVIEVAEETGCPKYYASTASVEGR